MLADIYNLIYEIKTGHTYYDFSKDKEMFAFSNYSAKSKYYDDSNKLLVGKIKDETGGIDTERFVGLKPKMYLLFVDNSSEHKKAKDVNKNVVSTISHDEYKDALLNSKCLRHLINRIQNKNHRIGTHKIIKFFLSCFDDKIYILNNGYDGIALGY